LERYPEEFHLGILGFLDYTKLENIMQKNVIQDKNLPQLSKVLNPEVMGPAFEAFFNSEYPGRGLKVENCRIGKVYHKPGKNCSIVYRLCCRDDDSRVFDLSFHGRISANSGTKTVFRTEQPRERPGFEFWKPISFWPEMNMALRTFPYDPGLPYLGQLLDIDFVKSQVEKNLSAFGLTEGWNCQEAVYHVGKYRPGKRCLIRYEVILADTENNRQQFIFYSKTYDSPRSRYVFDILRKIYASSACSQGLLNIPRPIAHIDSANTIWLLEWPGKSFSPMMQSQGWENFPKTGFLPKIAAMLAALHRAELPGVILHQGPSPAAALKNARGDFADIIRFLPEKQAVLAQMMEKMVSLAPAQGEKIPAATIHGSFKLAQLVCREDELALVDFDSVAKGDPLYDVAEFIASVVNLRVSDGVPTEPMTECIEIFLGEYQNRTPWPCDRSRIAWYVVAFLFGKIHSALKRGKSKEVSFISVAFSIVNEWLEVAGNR
jgi:hypothetical protein